MLSAETRSRILPRAGKTQPAPSGSVARIVRFLTGRREISLLRTRGSNENANPSRASCFGMFFKHLAHGLEIYSNKAGGFRPRSLRQARRRCRRKPDYHQPSFGNCALELFYIQRQV